MPTTGPKFPTLGTSVSESPWLDNAWTTPTNIYTDNAATANVTATSFDAPDQTYVLKATGFDFSAIPDNATILGVECKVNAWYRSGQGAGSIDLMQLLNASRVKVGTNQCLTPVALTTDAATIITKGGAADLWGNALTPAWVKDPDFGVALGILATAANADVDVDYVTLEVTYSIPVSGAGNIATAEAFGTALVRLLPTNGTIYSAGGILGPDEVEEQGKGMPGSSFGIPMHKYIIHSERR